MVEGSWHRDSHIRDHLWGYNEVFRQRHQSRYWMLAGGIRSEAPRGRVGLYYQLLAGGFAAGFRTDNEWPASIDVEAENAACGAYINGDLFYPAKDRLLRLCRSSASHLGSRVRLLVSSPAAAQPRYA